ncbi:unnamed protein product [Meganyctiphanes norvegica]|uniref:Uncharacterized protein n=1 Tax=Meganyctiphanes norvegica TaxID=48144 RepID=A0AAV2QM78_MEGNR
MCPLFIWPERDNRRKNMSPIYFSFKFFIRATNSYSSVGDTSVDCKFNIFIIQQYYSFDHSMGLVGVSIERRRREIFFFLLSRRDIFFLSAGANFFLKCRILCPTQTGSHPSNVRAKQPGCPSVQCLGKFQ